MRERLWLSRGRGAQAMRKACKGRGIEFCSRRGMPVWGRSGSGAWRVRGDGNGKHGLVIPLAGDFMRRTADLRSLCPLIKQLQVGELATFFFVRHLTLFTAHFLRILVFSVAGMKTNVVDVVVMGNKCMGQ